MELQLGDIFIFKADSNPLNKAVAYLTHSDVCHSGMLYQNNAIIEMGVAGVCRNEISVQEGDDVYIIRNTAGLDPQPLVNSANAYLQSKNHFNFPALVYLGGLLIYREMHPTKGIFQVLYPILLVACKELDKFIQHHIIHGSERELTCAQLVYQIYADCGENYKIRLHDTAMQPSDTDALVPSEQGIRLIDYAHSVPEEQTDLLLSEEEEKEVNTTESELINQLCDALEKQPQETELNLLQAKGTPFFNDPVTKLIKKFEARLIKLRDELKLNVPLDSLFVTPSDMLYHSDNLTQIGKVHIKRIL